jgi:transglutaminase-like putative cysteine protease
MPKLAITAPVNYPQLAWICLCLGLALAVHVLAIPLWVTGIIVVVATLRLGLAARGRAAPGRALRLSIAGASILILFLRFHTFNGLGAGTALLSLVAGLKLLETQSRRDVYIIALIIYFLCLAALLRSDSFWRLAYLIGVLWLTTTTLLRLTPSMPLPGFERSARYAGRMLVHALPLAVVFWLFFPRFDGPLWHMPSEGGSAETGLSDSMSPGDISELALSDDIAFRVHFLGATPPPRERYWRGPVLHDFDGHTWRRTDAPPAQGPPQTLSGAYRYILSLEPNQHNWIFMLDWPVRWDTPRAVLNTDYMLLLSSVISRPLDVTGTSYSHVRSAEPLSAAERQRDTALPRERNPRTRELAQKLRSAHADDMGVVTAALDLFRQQEFFYTLNPPQLGLDSVDEFLFDTKRGFCGHYASAFATLMRAAGIPARVVTGYQGGTFNRYADYWIVRQSQAHAWNEIWIETRGWVRIDPTSVVAPERVERGVNPALGSSSSFASRWQERTPWLADLRLRLDALEQEWRQRLLRFDKKSQENLLTFLGIPEPDGQKLVMVLAVGLALGLCWLTWQAHRELRPAPKDPLLRAYAQLCRKLAAAGIPRIPHEGAEAYAARVAAARPDLAAAVTRLCSCYSELRRKASPPMCARSNHRARHKCES